MWKKILHTSLIYTVGTVLAKLITFLLLPLYTNMIPTDDYGMYDLVVTWATILIPLLGADCWQSMLRFTKETEDEKKKLDIISQGFIMLFFSIIALSVVFLIAFCFIDIQHLVLIYLFYLTQLVQYFYIYSCRGFSKNKLFAVSGIVSSVLVALTSLFCIYCLGMTLESLYWSQIVSLLGQIIMLEYCLKFRRSLKKLILDKKTLAELYAYCVPEAIGTIFNWLLSSANRIIIVAYLGLYANGIYAISNKFVNILTIFLTAFILSYQEYIYADSAENISKNVNNVLNIMAKAMGPIVSLILVGTSIVYPFFVYGEYLEGYLLIPFFYIHFLFSSLTWVLSSATGALKKTKIALYEKMIIGPINFALVLLLINYFGLFASPIALIIAECIGLVAFKLLIEGIGKCNIILPIKQILFSLTFVSIFSVIYIVNNVLVSILAMVCGLALTYYIERKEIKIIIRKISDRRKSNEQ